MITEHTYYLPVYRRCFGTRANDPELVAKLYAAYMKYMPVDDVLCPNNSDGASYFVKDGTPTLRVIVRGNSDNKRVIDL